MKKFLMLSVVLALSACDSGPSSRCWSMGVKNLVAKIYQENRAQNATDVHVYDVVEEGIDNGLYSCSAKINYKVADQTETVSVEYTVRTLNAEHGPIIRVQFTGLE